MFNEVNDKIAKQKADDIDRRILMESVDEMSDEECPFTDEELDQIIDGDSIDEDELEKIMSHVDNKAENLDDTEIEELLEEDDDELGEGK